jgi:hypothetical protein
VPDCLEHLDEKHYLLVVLHMGAAGLQIVEVGVDTVAFALESTLN